MSEFPLPPYPPLPCTARFSTADFFRDSPWLAVPPHRKADILIEPLYPRLGLLGGAPEDSGKVSKLAALAAARKKKESEKNAGNSAPESDNNKLGSLNQKTATLSLHERLAGGGERRPSESRDAKLKLGRSGRIKSESPPQNGVSPSTTPEDKPQNKLDAKPEPEKQAPETRQKDQSSIEANLRAPPSTFATVMVGEAAPHTARAPSYLSSGVNVMEIFGQDVSEAYNFAGPSPDDIALNARNPTKGLSLANRGGKVS